MKKEQIVIWGTGKYGTMAYFFYNHLHIKCYVDSDLCKWGKKLHEIEICSPNVLKEMKDIKVVIAVKSQKYEIKQQLLEQYNIKTCVIFDIADMSYSELTNNKAIEMKYDKRTFIVSITSGLGNQMFQYALAKFLELQGKNVLADISWYTAKEKEEYKLFNVFPNIQIDVCDEGVKSRIIKDAIYERKHGGLFVIYQQPTIYQTKHLKGFVSFDDYMGAYIKGYFQTYHYADIIRDILLHDFTFPKVTDLGIGKLEKLVSEKNMISVHIRRGDYFNVENEKIYTDICTKEYYKKAIDYMKKHIPQCQFLFFSDDIQWVKKNMFYPDSMYVERELFQDYQDWYDMYIMSLCKHNIIANSTFSWWGAWLNQNPDKIVIAPKVWNNLCEYVDICPDSWIRF